MKSPLALLFCSHLLGIFVKATFSVFLSYPALLILLSSLLLLSWTFFKKKIFSLCLALVFIIGFTNSGKSPHDLPENHIFFNLPSKKVTITGVVVQDTETYKKGERLYLQINSFFRKENPIEVSGLIRLTFFGPGKSGAQYGDTLSISNVRLRLPTNFNNPGGFDYKKYLQRKGIYVIGTIRSADQVQVLQKKQHLNLYSAIYKYKSRMFQFLDSQTKPRVNSILKTMVFGEKGALSTYDRDLFSAVGIAHILAVSGLHMGFVSALFYFAWRTLFSLLLPLIAMRYFLLGYTAILSSFCTIPVVLTYGIMVGNSASSTRAGVMICVYLFSIILGRARDILASLTLAALLILLYNPSQLFDVGFQLSFSAVFCILYGYKRTKVLFPEKPILQSSYIKKKLTKHPFLHEQRKRLKNYLLIVLFASLGTLPITAYYFHSISLVGPLFNLIAVPMAAIIVPSTLLISFLSLFMETSAKILFIIPESITLFLLFLTERLANLELSFVRVVEFSIHSIAIYFILFMLVLHWSPTKLWRRCTVITLFIFITSLFLPSLFETVTRKGTLTVTFLDVGQGDSVFVQFPSGKTMLVDGGGAFGDFSIGKWVVAPYLWRNRLRTIDVVIATHSDRDHIGGLPYILNEFNIGLYIDNGSNKKDRTNSLLQQIVRDKQIPYKKASFGKSLNLDKETTVLFLNPSSQIGNDNDMSVVTRISYKNISFLLNGDIGKEIEKKVSKIATEMQTTIMSVPHHGSRFSSTLPFIKKTSPRVVVISAGKNNPFGHPHKNILQRYKNIGARIFRTDKDGAITISTDGKEFKVSTFIKNNDNLSQTRNLN